MEKSFNDISAHEYARQLSVEQMSRWICLIDGMNTIMDKIESLGFDEDIFSTKSGMNNLERALLKYIKERYDTVRTDILLDPRRYESELFTASGTEDEI